MEIAFVLGLLGVVMVLFARETLPVDVVTLLGLLALMVTRILTPAEAFAGFGSDIIIILASVFVISGALRESGVVDWLGEKLSRFHGGERSLLGAMMVSVSGLSAFMNNTTVTALLLPPVIGIARKRRFSPSKLLMPLAFASILGGTCTLIGTSTNVAVRGYMESSGLPPLGFFELTPVGLVLVAAGTLWMLVFGHRLLPTHPLDEELTENYGLRDYLSEIVIREDSPLRGQSLRKSDLGALGFRVLKVLRKGRAVSTGSASFTLQAGDVLVVNGSVESLLKVREIEGIDIRPGVKFGDRDLRSSELEILEVLVTPQSSFRGRRIQDLNLPARFGVAVLAINRHGQRLREKIKNIPLETGDLLLVQGARASMEVFRQVGEFAVLGEQNAVTHRGVKGWWVLGFLAAGILVSALGVVPLSSGLLGAALGAVLTGCVPMHKVYACIEWRLLVLIAGMTAFGLAMEKTHAAEWVSNVLLLVLEPGGGLMVLGGFMVLTVLLTQPMSNAAAALVALPIALAAAEKLHLNERTFAVSIALAASISLITPFEPSSLLVYGPGKYRFVDFFKVGGLLTALLLAIVMIMAPLLWPLSR